MCIQGKLIGKVCLENEANEEITRVYVHKIVIENLNELFYIYIYIYIQEVPAFLE